MKYSIFALCAALALVTLQNSSRAQGILGVNPVDLDKTAPSVPSTDTDTPVFGQKLKLTAPSPIASLAFSPDSRYLAAGVTNEILVWDAAGNVIQDLKAGGADLVIPPAEPAPGDPAKAKKRPKKPKTPRFPAESAVTSLLWSPDGTKLAGVVAGAGVGVWDANSGQLLVSLLETKDPVTAIAWSPNGVTLATGTNRGPVRLWDASSGALLKELSRAILPIQDLGFNVNGKTLTSLSRSLAKSDGATPCVVICRWDLASGLINVKREIQVSGDIEPKWPQLAIDGEYFVTATDFNARNPYEVWSTKSMAADFGIGAPTRDATYENSIHTCPNADEFLACGWGIKLYSVFDKTLIGSIHDPGGIYTYQKLIAAPATSAKNHLVAIGWDDSVYVYGP